MPIFASASLIRSFTDNAVNGSGYKQNFNDRPEGPPNEPHTKYYSNEPHPISPVYMCFVCCLTNQWETALLRSAILTEYSEITQ
jgi:hypothetical protein